MKLDQRIQKKNQEKKKKMKMKLDHRKQKKNQKKKKIKMKDK